MRRRVWLLTLLALAAVLATPPRLRAQQVETDAVGPAAEATAAPTPPPARRRLHGSIKLMTFWEDELAEPTSGWLIHVRLLIQNDDDVRLYAPDFILTTGGGLGDEFKGLRNRMKTVTGHGLDYPVDEKEDISACCSNPKRLPADNQIVKVVSFFVPRKVPNHANWRIQWRVQPPPSEDDNSVGPDDARGRPGRR